MSEDANLARAAVEAARASEAAGDYRTAAERYTAAGQAIAGANAAWAFHEAAVAWRRVGDPKRAHENLLCAIREDDGGNSRFSGQLALTEANVLADLSDWSTSAQAAMRASEHFRAAGAQVELLYCKIARARALAGLGEAGAAADAYQELADMSNPYEIRSQALNNLALLRHEAGDVDGAIALLRQDAELCRVRGDAAGALTALANAALILQQGDRGDAAVTMAREALSFGAGLEQTPAYALAVAVQNPSST